MMERVLPRVGHVYLTNINDARVLLCIKVSESDMFGRRFEFAVLDDGDVKGRGSSMRSWSERSFMPEYGFDMEAAMKSFAFTRID